MRQQLLESEVAFGAGFDGQGASPGGKTGTHVPWSKDTFTWLSWMVIHLVVMILINRYHNPYEGNPCT